MPTTSHTPRQTARSIGLALLIGGASLLGAAVPAGAHIPLPPSIDDDPIVYPTALHPDATLRASQIRAQLAGFRTAGPQVR